MVLAESDFLRWRGCLCKGRGYSCVCSDVSGDRGDLGLQEGEAVTEFQGVMISIQLLCVVVLLAFILIAVVRK
jgi:hypothetical protein